MMHKYDENEEQWLRSHYGITSYADMVVLFEAEFHCNISVFSIKNKCKNLGIVEKHYPFTPEQDDWLKAHNHEFQNYDEAADAFNRRFHTHKTSRGIQCHCLRVLKLVSGRQAYKKGHNTWNKMPIGHEYIHQSGYVYVKIKNTGIKNVDYEAKHRVLWEQYHNCKVPDGHIIVFLNSDKSDFSEENLYCMPRRIGRMMNTNHWFTESREHTLTAIRWCELFLAIQELI